MLEWIVKKVICGKINDWLKSYKGNVAKAKDTLKCWNERIKKVLACFESLLAKIDDDELSSDELKDAIDDMNTLIKEW